MRVLEYANTELKIYFYHLDHLGSSNMITDGDGIIIKSTEFYPYGRLRYEEKNEFESIYKYTGKELDDESDLILLRSTSSRSCHWKIYKCRSIINEYAWRLLE